jgi:hypothetical protein
MEDTMRWKIGLLGAALLVAFIFMISCGGGSSSGGGAGTNPTYTSPMISIVPSPAILSISLPQNWSQSFTINNTGPSGSTMNYTVADDGALGGFLDVQNASGSLKGGQSSTVTVSVKPDFVSGVPTLVGSTLGLSVYTPNAANYIKSLVTVKIIKTEIIIQSSDCTYLGKDNSGNNQFSLNFSGTASAGENNKLSVGNVGYPNASYTMSCAGWTGGDGTFCTRMPGNSLTTTWSWQETFIFGNGPGSTSGGALWSIFQNGNILTSVPMGFSCTAI